jgi:AcrR family transcriptional regulator
VTGLRQRKKRKTSDAIVSVAADLFREPGYEETTIEMISSAAGVSPGTIYNYFGTKNAILTAVVTRDTESALDLASGAIDLQASDPVDVLMPVIDVYVDLTLGLGPGELRELFRTVLDSGQRPLADDIISLDERAVGQLADALAQMRTAGMLADPVDPMEAAYLVYTLVAGGVMVFMSVPGTTHDDVKSVIRQQLALVFKGLAAPQPTT